MLLEWAIMVCSRSGQVSQPRLYGSGNIQYYCYLYVLICTYRVHCEVIFHSSSKLLGTWKCVQEVSDQTIKVVAFVYFCQVWYAINGQLLCLCDMWMDLSLKFIFKIFLVHFLWIASFDSNEQGKKDLLPFRISYKVVKPCLINCWMITY